jgi:hypothetical protein
MKPLSFFKPAQTNLVPDYEDPAAIERPGIISLKTMLTVEWNPHRFPLVNILHKRQMWMSQYYIGHILAKFCSLHSTRDRRRLVVEADKARRHVAKRVKQFLQTTT